LRWSTASRLAFVALLGGLALLFSSCEVFSSPQNTFGPEGEVARDQRYAFMLTMWFALGIMISVEAACVVLLVMFRRRKGHEGMPKQVHGNNFLEISWTIAPAILLIAFIPLVVAGIFKLGNTPDGAVQVEINAFRFGWFYGHYDADGNLVETAVPQVAATQDEVSGDPLVVPVGRDVALKLHSSDVIHSFWVPKLAGKTDVMPGRTNHMWFKADKVGTYQGQCAEFCGLSHAYMRLTVEVVSQENYSRYVSCLGDPELPGCDQTLARIAGE
jgi:cytochrome c oxidase subunit 2